MHRQREGAEQNRGNEGLAQRQHDNANYGPGSLLPRRTAREGANGNSFRLKLETKTPTGAIAADGVQPWTGKCDKMSKTSRHHLPPATLLLYRSTSRQRLGHRAEMTTMFSQPRVQDFEPSRNLPQPRPRTEYDGKRVDTR